MPTSPNAFTSYLQKDIQAHGGSISFANYMTLALFHPEFGYYNSPTFTLGKQGDFITAPEISPLFAACCAKQFSQVFEPLETKNILELGAGTGRFACDVLHELERLHALPEHYYIYEISIPLREKQAQFLKANGEKFLQRIVWLEELPQDFTGIIFANEVLDVLPVHCFAMTETGIKERGVAWEKDQFVFKFMPENNPELAEQALQIAELYELPPGYQSEICLALAPFIQTLAKTLTCGAIFFIDYGYGQAEYYHPERQQGTLTCFYHHQHHSNPFQFPGQQDITAHVDFTRVAENGVSSGLELAGYTSQAAFLLALGLIDLAAQKEKNLSIAEAFNSHQAIKLLTMPTEMGERIKVMAFTKQLELPLLGFRFQDRRRDL